MIKVRVRNFQSIADASIVIEGLTVVTGENNAGKSALFRAIRGAFTNMKSYDFVRVGQSHCTVDLTFEDGRTLTWEKGRKDNRYIVNGKVFNNVDRGVPPEAQVFGVEPITVDGNKLWPQIAPQVTGVVFLLDQPGSVIAEAVADVERVNQLSSALKASETDRRSAKQDLKLRMKDAQELGDRRAAFGALEPILESLESIEKRHAAAERTAKAITNLDRLGIQRRRAAEEVQALLGLGEVETALPKEGQVQKAREVAQAYQELRALRERWAAARSAVAALEGLEEVQGLVPSEDRMAYGARVRQGIGVTVGLAARLEKAQLELRTANSAQRALSQISLDDALPARLEKFTKALGATRGLRNRYARARDEVAALHEELAQCEQQEAEARAQVASVLGEFKECPTCGGKLDHMHPGV